MRITHFAATSFACCVLMAQGCSDSTPDTASDGTAGVGEGGGAAASDAGGRSTGGAGPKSGGGGPSSGGARPGGGGTSTGGKGSSTGGAETGTGGTREPPPVEGQAYYVAMDGEDNDECSEAAPCRTLQQAADVASEPGSVVFVANGEYVGFHSSYDDVTFYADGDSVVVNEGHSWGSDQTGDNINIEENNGVVIDGFIVRDATHSGIRAVNCTDAIIRNNIVESNPRGILTGFAVRVQILNNQVSDSTETHGIYVANSESSEDDPVISGNVVHGSYQNGIQINGDCFAGGDGTISGAIVENNVVYDNGWKGLSIISAPGVTIRNNVITDNGTRGAGAGGIHLVNEPDCDASQSTIGGVVVNNTIVEPRISGIAMDLDATENVIFNNLVVSSNPISDEVGGNLVSSSNLTRDSSAGLFGDDYQLASNSPAIDAGEASYSGVSAPTKDIDGTARPQGDGFDVGAYERQ